MAKNEEQKRYKLRNFYPDYIYEKVEDIPYETMAHDGIRLILMDMDNTLIDRKCNYSKDLKRWVKNMKAKGVNLYILSNSHSQKKVKRIAKELGLKYSYKAGKPSRKGFKKVCDIFPDICKKEILMVGDQLFTDVWGGNRYNIKTCLVKRINKSEIFISRVKRPLEKMVLNHYYKKPGNEAKCRIY